MQLAMPFTDLPSLSLAKVIGNVIFEVSLVTQISGRYAILRTSSSAESAEGVEIKPSALRVEYLSAINA